MLLIWQRRPRARNLNSGVRLPGPPVLPAIRSLSLGQGPATEPQAPHCHREGYWGGGPACSIPGIPGRREADGSVQREVVAQCPAQWWVASVTVVSLFNRKTFISFLPGRLFFQWYAQVWNKENHWELQEIF